jgi:hypothetical protein
MGSDSATTNLMFCFKKIYDNLLEEKEWQLLQSLIRTEEVEAVILSWPRNKSSGPDGFTGEFFRHFKDMLLPDLLSVLNSVAATPEQTLALLNDSFIALILEKRGSI